MAKITGYVKEAYGELKNKVSWPSWKDLQSSAIIVMIASFIIGFIIFLMDSAFSNLLKIIYNL